MKKNNVDWIIHYVFSTDENDGWKINAHTHGLNKHNHPKLMIVLPIQQEVCGDVLNSLGFRILNGERFDQEGIRMDLITNNLPIKLVRENIAGKKILF